ncbi:glycosyltransferase family 39 protein [Patescibacteria group bacterium]|nr:glycosyltransferase family 39 protein [Patescibacteria group bacterium]MBU4353417.1 glycosyltransferase family 39 protein [Patescibacteria group bacterium]MCG2699164.1 glycosyltransferase family 39 protein [Candidatus Parcubacteria bacterium]
MNMAIPTFFKKHKIAIIIFLAALLVRALLFFISFNHNGGNLLNTISGYDGYYEISRNLADNGVFSVDSEAPFAPHPLRPPLYPYYLAGLLVLFGSYWVVTIFNLIIASLLPVLGFFIVKQAIAYERISIAAGFAMALEPFSALLSFIFYTETFFIFLFFIFLIFFFKYFKENSLRNIAWASVFLGLATLVKPTTQYLPIVIPILILWHFRKNISKKTFYHIASFAVIFLMLISPWLYRNYEEFGAVGMTAQPAFNLYMYFTPTVLSLDKGTEYKKELADLTARDGVDGTEINLSNSDYFISRSLNEIKNHPIGIIKSLGVSAVTFFTHDGVLTVFKHLNITIPGRFPKPAFMMFFNSPIQFFMTIWSILTVPLIAVILMKLFWVFVTAIFLLGVVLFMRKEKFSPQIISALFLVAYFAATTFINGLGINARFRQPVNLFIFMFAAYGLLNLKQSLSNRQAPLSK